MVLACAAVFALPASILISEAAGWAEFPTLIGTLLVTTTIALRRREAMTSSGLLTGAVALALVTCAVLLAVVVYVWVIPGG